MEWRAQAPTATKNATPLEPRRALRTILCNKALIITLKDNPDNDSSAHTDLISHSTTNVQPYQYSKHLKRSLQKLY